MRGSKELIDEAKSSQKDTQTPSSEIIIDPLASLFDSYKKFTDFRDDFEKRFIQHKLQTNNWNVSKTADEIEMQRSHLYSKIDKYGLKRDA